MALSYRMWIDGQWVSGTKFSSVTNPFNGEKLGDLPLASSEMVDAAIASAFTTREEMEELPIHRRAEILENTAGYLEKHQSEFVTQIALEAGKPLKWATVEVQRGIENLKFAAEACKSLHGETVPMDASRGSEGRMGFWLRVPMGVVAAISPFNFPLNLVIHKVAPAIAAGNTVVLKPASNTPGPAQLLVQALLESGLPPKAIQLVYGGGSDVGMQLVKDERIAKITFTGSPAVGRIITKNAGLKKLTLELGSNSGTIIDESADLDWAVSRNVMGSFAYSGQVCISVQRIYVHEKQFDAFTEQFVSATRQLRTGDPLDPQTDVGPMISEMEARRVEEWIAEARTDGATVLTGGTREGAVFSPTVLTNVNADMKVVCQEVFGPVVSVVPIRSFEEGIERINDSIFGLQAGVFTQNLSYAFRAIRKIQVGGVMINDVPTYRVDHMPYGGVKESGIGREGARFAIEEMTNIKMVMIK